MNELRWLTLELILLGGQECEVEAAVVGTAAISRPEVASGQQVLPRQERLGAGHSHKCEHGKGARLHPATALVRKRHGNMLARGERNAVQPIAAAVTDRPTGRSAA